MSAIDESHTSPRDIDGLEQVDNIDDLLPWARENDVSDLHIGGYGPVWIERHGLLECLNFAVGEESIRSWLGKNLSEAMFARLQRAGGDVRRGGLGDGSKHVQGVGNLRIHAWRSRNAGGSGIEVTIRMLAPEIPTFEKFGYPAVLKSWAEQASGLVLVGAPTGSGKTTMLAAMIDHINRTAARHILTVEDPVEYFHKDINSRVRHCEIGEDVGSYEDALVGFLRAKPHVIVPAEIRDMETMANVLSGAETGHLVMATVHARDVEQIIRRVIDFFPADRQELVRSQLVANLVGVVSCRLPRRRDGKRVIATEICDIVGGANAPAILANIKECNLGKIRDELQLGGQKSSSHTLEMDLARLASFGPGGALPTITPEAARAWSEQKNDPKITALFAQSVR